MKEKITTIKVWDKKYRLIPFLVLLFLFLALVIFILGVCYRLSEEFNKKKPCQECHNELEEAKEDIKKIKFDFDQKHILLTEVEDKAKAYAVQNVTLLHEIEELKKQKEKLYNHNDLIITDRDSLKQKDELNNHIIAVKENEIANYRFLLNLTHNNNQIQLSNINEEIRKLREKNLDQDQINEEITNILKKMRKPCNDCDEKKNEKEKKGNESSDEMTADQYFQLCEQKRHKEIYGSLDSFKSSNVSSSSAPSVPMGSAVAAASFRPMF